MPILSSPALESRSSATAHSIARRQRSAWMIIRLAVIALLLGAISILSIGVFILIGALPFFALGIALHPSRTHYIVGGIGLASGLFGAGLLAYVLLT